MNATKDIPEPNHTFCRSESISQFAAAMAKAQGAMTGALKDSLNPHYKSSYADLASVRAACMPHLSAAGIAVSQFPCAARGYVEVETILIHESGEWMSNLLSLPVLKDDAHGIGSAITYARRYALASICGIAPEDDDGNAAVGRPSPEAPKTPQVDLRAKALSILEPVTKQGIEAYRLAFNTLSPEMRKSIADDHSRLKAAAAQADADKAQEAA